MQGFSIYVTADITFCYLPGNHFALSGKYLAMIASVRMLGKQENTHSNGLEHCVHPLSHVT